MSSVKTSVEHGVVDRTAVIDNPSVRYASSLYHSPSHLVGRDDRTVDERVAFVMRVANCTERQFKAVLLSTFHCLTQKKRCAEDVGLKRILRQLFQVRHPSTTSGAHDSAHAPDSGSQYEAGTSARQLDAVGSRAATASRRECEPRSPWRVARISRAAIGMRHKALG